MYPRNCGEALRASALEHAARLHEVGTEETKRALNQAVFEPFEADLVDEGGTPLAEAAHEATCHAEAGLYAPVAAVVQFACPARGAPQGPTPVHKDHTEKPPASLRLPGVPT